jgi:glycosyltransferase involved in cell wall biosynthesis
MASSLPVISTSSAGEIKDRIEDGINGYIVMHGDSNAIFTKMLALIESPNLIKSMGLNSLSKINGKTPEKWATDFENAVEKIYYSE